MLLHTEFWLGQCTVWYDSLPFLTAVYQSEKVMDRRQSHRDDWSWRNEEEEGKDNREKSHLNGGQNWMWRKKEGERKKNKIERQKRKKLERKKIKRQDGQRCRCDIKRQVLAAEPWHWIQDKKGEKRWSIHLLHPVSEDNWHNITCIQCTYNNQPYCHIATFSVV